MYACLHTCEQVYFVCLSACTRIVVTRIVVTGFVLTRIVLTRIMLTIIKPEQLAEGS